MLTNERQTCILFDNGSKHAGNKALGRPRSERDDIIKAYLKEGK
jgi:hypothetical protein